MQGKDPVKGSVELDVVENTGSPTAVWDYKFGNARLSAKRIQQIPNEAGLGANVPVLEVKP
jgi:hypothetical protein